MHGETRGINQNVSTFSPCTYFIFTRYFLRPGKEYQTVKNRLCLCNNIIYIYICTPFCVHHLYCNNNIYRTSSSDLYISIYTSISGNDSTADRSLNYNGPFFFFIHTCIHRYARSYMLTISYTVIIANISITPRKIRDEF